MAGDIEILVVDDDLPAAESVTTQHPYRKLLVNKA